MKNLIISLGIITLGLLGCQAITQEVVKPNPQRGAILVTFDGYSPKTPIWGRDKWCASSLTSLQKENVMRQVEQYFSIWDVSVMSSDMMFYCYPSTHRVRVVVTQDTIWAPYWTGPYPVEGVSEYNSLYFCDTTAAVVSSALAKGRCIADDIAHEIGHTLGLAHQSVWLEGEPILQYNPGDSLVAPIMGQSCLSLRATWWTGTNSFGQEQDDEAIISKTFKIKTPWRTQNK